MLPRPLTEMQNEWTDLKHQTACILFLPEAVDYVNLNKVSCVLVEMRDEKVNIVQVVELPALCNQGVAEYVPKSDGVGVGSIREILNPRELEGRLEGMTDLMCW